MQLAITDPVPFPWKAMEDVEFDYSDRFVVLENGISRWAGGRVASGNFLVASCKFGEFPKTTSDDFHPSTKRLISALTVVGAKPRFMSGASGQKVSFAFDISAGKTRAIYELAALSGGRQIMSWVFCDTLDSPVLENVHLIDRAMYALLAKCGMPLTGPPN